MKRKFHVRYFAAAAAAAFAGAAMCLTAYAGTWIKDQNGWWWQNDDGTYPASCWQWIDGNFDGTAECYYFNDGGYMLSSTVTPDGYFVNGDGAWMEGGAVVTQPSGQGQSSQDGAGAGGQSEAGISQGWRLENGLWRYREGSSDVAGTWKNINGSRYYFEDDGFMVTGFCNIDGDEYYFDNSGALAKRTFKLDGVVYVIENNDGVITDEVDEEDYYEYGSWSGGGSGNGVNVKFDTGGGSGSGSGSGGSSGGYSSGGSGSSEEDIDAEAYAYEVFELVNKERASRGLHELEWNDELALCAEERAEELVEKFSHTRPDGTSCFTIFEEHGVRAGGSGENIAAGQPTPEAVMDAWMRSPGHKANILSEKVDFEEMGVGFYHQSSGYKYYWVQLFIS